MAGERGGRASKATSELDSFLPWKFFFCYRFWILNIFFFFHLFIQYACLLGPLLDCLLWFCLFITLHCYFSAFSFHSLQPVPFFCASTYLFCLYSNFIYYSFDRFCRTPVLNKLIRPFFFLSFSTFVK